MNGSKWLKKVRMVSEKYKYIKKRSIIGLKIAQKSLKKALEMSLLWIGLFSSLLRINPQEFRAKRLNFWLLYIHKRTLFGSLLSSVSVLVRQKNSWPNADFLSLLAYARVPSALAHFLLFLFNLRLECVFFFSKEGKVPSTAIRLASIRSKCGSCVWKRRRNFVKVKAEEDPPWRAQKITWQLKCEPRANFILSLHCGIIIIIIRRHIDC